ncbi:MAG: MBL fold metallo-hydrolase [Betaproteobacteria bacterium]|nr:MBL fold metallo-hydrolase [Betaproteobacteria bacterium]
MLRIEMLAARHGDCLCVEYGEDSNPYRILIDGGPGFAYPALRARLLQIPANKRRVDLMVVTHIDADHIEGAIKLLGDADLDLAIGDLWYNGHSQLTSAESFSFGALQGEYLSALIEARKLPWNKVVDGGPIVIPAKSEALHQSVLDRTKLPAAPYAPVNIPVNPLDLPIVYTERIERGDPCRNSPCPPNPVVATPQ